MSNPIAYPVFRTTDPGLALRVTRQLVAVGDRRYAEVSVDVELRTTEEVLRLCEALPDAWFRKEDVEDWARDPSDPTGLHGGVHAPELSTDLAFLSSYLPLWASMENRPVDSVEEEFAALVGPRNGTLRGWPSRSASPSSARHRSNRRCHGCGILEPALAAVGVPIDGPQQTRRIEDIGGPGAVPGSGRVGVAFGRHYADTEPAGQARPRAARGQPKASGPGACASEPHSLRPQPAPASSRHVERAAARSTSGRRVGQRERRRAAPRSALDRGIHRHPESPRIRADIRSTAGLEVHTVRPGRGESRARGAPRDARTLTLPGSVPEVCHVDTGRREQLLPV
ncbi:hypothetical protein AB0N62_04920 [Streptomyces sp. NPDC093982]|uniref:hypothetical protein n=1 Tax=Streptomyces sp. NPDC093982 TaxID=3155077 RepID=UPI00343FC627